MSINKVILMGYVGQDPEVRHMDNGVTVANFTLATTERAYTLPNGTEVPERTEWHNIVLWRGVAEVAEKYVHKGDRIYIEGSMHTRKFTTASGHEVTRMEIFGNTLELITRKQ